MKYRKRADKPVVIIPGVGAVADDRVLEGNYERFVPGLLERLPDEAPAPAPEPEPVPEPALDLQERETVPQPEPESEEDEEDEEDDEDEEDEEDEGEDLRDEGVEVEETPDMTWLKNELITYADSLGVELDGTETKQDLLDKIAEARG